MVNQNYTDITLILDRSGSMISMGNEPIEAVNTFIKEQSEVPGECLVTRILFDDRVEILDEATLIGEVIPLNRDTYYPRGMTALLDAVGNAINKAGIRFSNLPEEDRPGKVIFLVLTDGQENSSSEYNPSQIKELIKKQTNQFKWSFVYLGADAKSFTEAQKTGFVMGNTATFNAADPGSLTRSTRGISAAYSSYRTTGVGGQSLTQDVTNEGPAVSQE